MRGVQCGGLENMPQKNDKKLRCKTTETYYKSELVSANISTKTVYSFVYSLSIHFRFVPKQQKNHLILQVSFNFTKVLNQFLSVYTFFEYIKIVLEENSPPPFLPLPLATKIWDRYLWYNWKLWAFRQRSNFSYFQQFIHNFRLKWIFWNLMISS